MSRATAAAYQKPKLKVPSAYRHIIARKIGVVTYDAYSSAGGAPVSVMDNVGPGTKSFFA
jgi:hypothetical protein